MDRLTSLRVFRDVVESGSFVAAAERLGLSAPMASKHLAQLEASLGARLLHRTSRRLSLTEAGTLYYDQCRQALDLLDGAEAAIGQRQDAPRGVLQVSAPVWCATPRVARALAAYRQACPDVLVDLHLENRRVDLVAEGYDLALRATPEPSPALIARPLCPVRFHLVASPDFVARHGLPRTPAELARLDAVVPSYVRLESMRLHGPSGSRPPLRLQPALRSDDTTLSLQAVHAGLGLALLPGWLVDDDLAAGRLVPLLPDHAPPAITLYAVYASRRQMAPKVRTFIDFLGTALGGGAARADSAPA